MELVAGFEHIDNKKKISRSIRLRYTSEKDIESIVDILNKPEVYEAIYWIPRPYTLEDAQAWVIRAEKGSKNKNEFLFSIISKFGDCIGAVNLHQTKNEFVFELGYWLHPSYWGKGIMTKATGLAIKRICNLVKVHKISATTSISNTASQRILLQHGFIIKRNLLIKNSKREYRESILFEKNMK